GRGVLLHGKRQCRRFRLLARRAPAGRLRRLPEVAFALVFLKRHGGTSTAVRRLSEHSSPSNWNYVPGSCTDVPPTLAITGQCPSAGFSLAQRFALKNPPKLGERFGIKRRSTAPNNAGFKGFQSMHQIS